MEASCVICYRPITRTTKSILLPCFHCFCYHCIVHWLKKRAICPICSNLCWMLIYTIRSNDDYKILSIRPDPLYLECDCSPPIDTEQPTVYRPHMFINERGEYECTVVETNRIRALCNLP
ncbi:hypothetical protein WA588_003285, partial [Blastocystis sp. NMH]